MRLHDSIEKKGWEDNISIIGDIILVDTYDIGNDDNFFKFINSIANRLSMEWGYNDEYIIDYDHDKAYRVDSGDYIIMDGYIIGRDSYNDSCLDDIISFYNNNPSRALPNWLELEVDLEFEGWERRSCDFQSGLYDQHDDPKKIYDSLKDYYNSVIFQIESITPFAVDFCVWVKK